MTFHVLFFSITIQRKQLSQIEMFHEQHIQDAMNDIKERQCPYSSHL
ncbi:MULTISPECIES: YrzI family small protein [Bacillus cereus group]|uniref:YrzI family protein n=1 Tax=Bacillus cereus TaxID=1396 RepID=A0AA44QB68_BACCE|nr:MULTISPECIES: YrzI family small protein [Bacillus cereus group]PFN00424.1 YrzI family protein [Bacillus cereus]PFO78904.1 YrzI family protein [Bacillus cereus]PFR19421.1 YrzI family protein [Bacillus cereus]PFS02104.1 YrzI family protein [Bacillus cereus]